MYEIVDKCIVMYYNVSKLEGKNCIKLLYEFCIVTLIAHIRECVLKLISVKRIDQLTNCSRMWACIEIRRKHWPVTQSPIAHIYEHVFKFVTIERNILSANRSRMWAIFFAIVYCILQKILIYYK